MPLDLFAHHEITVGLDISDHVLRLVILKPGRPLKLIAATDIDVPEGVIVHGEIIKADLVIDLCKKLRQKAGRIASHAHYAVACLPEPTSFLKLITVAPSVSNDLVKDIYTETAAHLPMSLDETYIDWQLISAPGSGSVEALVAAAPRITVDRYIKVLTQAGFEPMILEIEPISIGRAVLTEDAAAATQTVAVLDLGATRTGFTVFKNLVPQFSVSLPVSGRAWTAAIAAGLNLTVDQAEEAKRRCGLDNPDCQEAIKDIVNDSLTELQQRLQEAIGYYDGHFAKNQPLQRLVITGGGAQLPGLKNYLQQAVKLPVDLAAPLKNIVSKHINLTNDQALQYSTALGLARRALIKQTL